MASLHSWEFPQKPWFRIHLDYAESCEEKMFLIIVDAHSKCLDVYPMNTATSVGKFKEHGLLGQCETYYTTGFTSSKFEEFMTNDFINHITQGLYHPTTNGQVEQTI